VYSFTTGVTASPGGINIYDWHFEGSSPVLLDAHTVFYGQYIDDCLAIVYVQNEADALDFVSLGGSPPPKVVGER